MDKAVLDAIERWPDVPAVFGWLSLSRRGQWRLHPGGTALAGGYGESIQNQQILSFMDRNYTCDEQGQWFFQNGPQRVFVRLDSAPLIVSLTGQPALLRTHNQLEVQRIDDWLIDHDGNLFLQCDQGAASINDLDLELVRQSTTRPKLARIYCHGGTIDEGRLHRLWSTPTVTLLFLLRGQSGCACLVQTSLPSLPWVS